MRVAKEAKRSQGDRILEKSVSEGVIITLIALMLISVAKNVRFPVNQVHDQGIQRKEELERGVMINPDRVGQDIFRIVEENDTHLADIRGLDYINQKIGETKEAILDLSEEDSSSEWEKTDYQYPKRNLPNKSEFTDQTEAERTDGKRSSAGERAEQGTKLKEDKTEEQGKGTEESGQPEKMEEPPAAVLTGLVCEGSLAAPVCVGAKSLNLEGMRFYGLYSNGEKIALDPEKCTVLGCYTKTPGTYKGMLQYQGKQVEFTYQVAAYRAEVYLNGGYIESANGRYYYLYDYILNAVDSPLKNGYTFVGWYLDEALTKKVEFPYQAAFGHNEFNLYAKWVEAESPFIVTNGMITDFAGRVDDWMIRLPDKKCYGIARDAFVNLKGNLKLIDIPPNYTKIEPGAFRGLGSLESINIDFKNNVYTSIDEAVYTKDKKTLVAYPEAIKGEYAMREDRKAEHIGDLAFYNSSLTKLVFPTSIKTIGDYAIGGNIKTVRFTGETLPEYISPRAFGSVLKDKCPVIEVPDTCLEEYREMFAQVHPYLANAVVGYKKL